MTFAAAPARSSAEMETPPGERVPNFHDLLALEPLTAEQIKFLLDRAATFQKIQQHPLKKLATLRGKSVALAFFEPSTRTRISFATAASRLGADSLNLQAESSSLKKGESLLDTVHTLNAMKPDCIVMRHSASGATHFVGRQLEIPVINAGDGTHEHPTQGLLDALTIRDRLGTIENLNVTILGDILHSRVARSNIHLLTKFGCRVTLCGPAMWLPPELEQLTGCANSSRGSEERRGSIRRTTRIEEALQAADVIITLRVQQERLNEPALPLDEYVLLYQLTPARLALAKPKALVLHPGPMIRGLEIDPAVADGPQSCVLEQVTNGIAVRMALLFLLIGTSADTQTGTPPDAGGRSAETQQDSSHAAN